MSLRPVSATVVIVAQRFNPSIVRDHWLIEHGILSSSEELLDGFVFTDMLVQFRTKQFDMLVTPDQFQFVPKVSENDQEPLIREKVGKIVETLPHTPYTAMGLNFHWIVRLPIDDAHELTRKLFFKPECPLHNQFDTPDAWFGGYMSKDFGDFRLKLDAKPVGKSEEREGDHSVQFAFNFHKDLEGPKDTRVGEVVTLLQQWDTLRNESSRLASAATDGGKQ